MPMCISGRLFDSCQQNYFYHYGVTMPDSFCALTVVQRCLFLIPELNWTEVQITRCCYSIYFIWNIFFSVFPLLSFDCCFQTQASFELPLPQLVGNGIWNCLFGCVCGCAIVGTTLCARCICKLDYLPIPEWQASSRAVLKRSIVSIIRFVSWSGMACHYISVSVFQLHRVDIAFN